MISHSINLIDTPGHADFTFEVLRSLRILDGAVCILDGVAGVEAQTEKVWHQASIYSIPRIVYVNKLDRDGAAFGRTVKEVGSRLGGWPALCQIPWWEGGKGRFTGVGDVLGLRGLKWGPGGDGKVVKVSSLETLLSTNPTFAEEIKKARIALVEILSEYDDDMVEKYLEYNEDHLAIPAADIINSLRKCISNGDGTIIPVFAGASFQNIGVQPLLDAIVDLLPEPSERNDAEISIEGSKSFSTEGWKEGLISLLNQKEIQASKKSKNQKALSSNQKAAGLISNLEACALAFKVVNDPRRGVLVYVRVYSGSINRNASLFNTSLQLAERAPRLLRMYASDAVEIPSIPAGQIGVIVGLKYARTGDTLISYKDINPKHPPPTPFNSLQLRPIDVPPPVFFASVEPQSLSEEKHLSESLNLLLREDPSLHVTVDEDSGQTLLSGMGELHLEIAKDRLVGDFKAKASMGKIEIGYRECILAASPSPIHHIFEKNIGGKAGQAGCTASVSRLDPISSVAFGEQPDVENNLVTASIPSYDITTGDPFDNTTTPPLPPHLNVPLIINSLQNGALASLARGPHHGYPLHGVHVTLTFTAEDIFGSLTTPTALTSAARAATSSALNAATGPSGEGSGIMEPVMSVTITVDEGSMGAVIHDISSSRGGQVLSLESDDTESSSSQPSHQSIDALKIYAPPDPFASSNESNSTISMTNTISNSSVMRNVRARVPLKEMIGYLKHLRSLSKGRGTFVMEFDRFERVTGVRERRVLEEKGRGF
jgi:elongation factor G